VQRRQQQKLRLRDLERALGGDTWCVKKTVRVMESSVATCILLYRTSAILLMFSSLALFYVNPVFEINPCCVYSWHHEVIIISKAQCLLPVLLKTH